MRTASSISTFVGLSAALACLASSADSAVLAQLDRATALAITENCVQASLKNDWPPFAIAIFDSNARLITFQAMDGVMAGAVDLALGKARTSANFPFSTMDIASLVESNAGAKGLATFPGIVTVQGGLPIMVNGQHVGGIGVSGGMPAQDEACARAALKE